jgi:hypothetical protein
VSGQQHAPVVFNPPLRPGTHCTGGWVGHRAGLDGRNISPSPGFDPRTVQPVVSRYTDENHEASGTQAKNKHEYVRVQASAAVRLRSSFYTVMVSNVGWQSGTRLPLKIGPIRFPETSVTNNHPLLRNIPVKLRRKHKYLHTTFQNVLVIGRSVARPRTHRAQRLPVRVDT